MDDLWSLAARNATDSLEASLNDINAVIGQFGLSLTARQMQTIVAKQNEALADAGRLEFGPGIVRKLIEEFCDSPFIDQENYEEIILELLDAFYCFKNESEDRIDDDELIMLMHRYFDTTCRGAIDYLTGATLEELCRPERG